MGSSIIYMYIGIYITYQKKRLTQAEHGRNGRLDEVVSRDGRWESS